MRIRLVHTLALWLLAAVAASVLAMGVTLAWTLNQGFSAYLRERDAARLEAFADLAGERLRESGGIDALRTHRITMPQLLREMAQREGAGVPPSGAPPHGAPDGMPPLQGRADGPPDGPPGMLPPGPVPTDAFGARVALFDLDGRQLPSRPLPAGKPLIEKPVRIDGQVVAWARMLPSEPLPSTSEMRFLRTQRIAIAVVAAAMMALALLLAWLLARRWAAPLQAVQDATARIARGELGVRIAQSRTDEIGDVLHNVNAMAESLQRMEGARRRWIADISHELRTPLAALRGEIEALVDGVRPLTADAVRSLREEVLRLGSLVDDLHLLAVADLKGVPCRFAECDAVRIVTQAQRRFAPRAAAVGLSLEWLEPPPGSLVVTWDAARIDQLLANLLENSIRYTDAPGRIALSVRHEGEAVMISVDDTPPGASAVDIGRLFEPLYRADAARTRHGGGSGLGLAICEAIARAHGGHMRAQASPLGGLRIAAILPLQASGDAPQ